MKNNVQSWTSEKYNGKYLLWLGVLGGICAAKTLTLGLDIQAVVLKSMSTHIPVVSYQDEYDLNNNGTTSDEHEIRHYLVKYDSQGRLKGVVGQKYGCTTCFTGSLVAYDDNGNIVARQNADESIIESYEYSSDGLNRVISEWLGPQANGKLIREYVYNDDDKTVTVYEQVDDNYCRVRKTYYNTSGETIRSETFKNVSTSHDMPSGDKYIRYYGKKELNVFSIINKCSDHWELSSLQRLKNSVTGDNGSVIPEGINPQYWNDPVYGGTLIMTGLYYIDIPEINLLNDWAVSLTFKREVTASGDSFEYYLAGKPINVEDGSPNINNYIKYYQENVNSTLRRYIMLKNDSGASARWEIPCSNDMERVVLHAKNGKVTLFHNGVWLGSKDINGHIIMTAIGAGHGTNLLFKGNVADVAIWDSSIEAVEGLLADHYNMVNNHYDKWTLEVESPNMTSPIDGTIEDYSGRRTETLRYYLCNDLLREVRISCDNSGNYMILNDQYYNAYKETIDDNQSGVSVEKLVKNNKFNRITTWGYDEKGNETNRTMPIVRTGTPEPQKLNYISSYDDNDYPFRKTKEAVKDGTRILYYIYYVYDQYGNIKSTYQRLSDNETSPRFNETKHKYNAFGELYLSRTSSGVVTGKTYDDFGHLETEFVIKNAFLFDGNTANGEINDYIDLVSRMRAVPANRLEMLSLTRYVYNGNGRQEYVKVAKCDTSFKYCDSEDGSTADEVLNNVIWLSTKYEYDAYGRQKAMVQDAMLKDIMGVVLPGHNPYARNLRTEYWYNYQNEIEKTMMPSGKWVKVVRDGRGLIFQEITGYTYDMIDRVVSITEYDYNEDGNVHYKKLPDNTFIHYIYDDYGRLKSEENGLMMRPI